MNDQCLLVGSAAAAALGSMAWEFGVNQKTNWPAAIVGVFSIVGLSYLAINPVGERHVVSRQVPIANSVVGIQNISLEDPLISKFRHSLAVAVEAYRNEGPCPEDWIADNTDGNGNIIPAYWRMK